MLYIKASNVHLTGKTWCDESAFGWSGETCTVRQDEDFGDALSEMCGFALLMLPYISLEHHVYKLGYDFVV